MDTMGILQINSEIYMLVCKEMSSKCLENPLYLLTLNPSQKKKRHLNKQVNNSFNGNNAHIILKFQIIIRWSGIKFLGNGQEIFMFM